MNADWGMLVIRLGAATAIGLVIGFEREWRGHDAGLRTHAMVALSAAMLTLTALLIAHDMAGEGQASDPLRVIQGLAQAIGFIAAGLIFVRNDYVRNLTTAASLWIAASLGIACGAGQFRLVVIGIGLTLVLLTFLEVAKRLLPTK